ncbi:hypothetical protein J8273_0142 [Carpediemonas membranifera]|uniref:t-SNARE coiled-coil homology domain-containing protein n=1 Tax=Carpediemonas membranifera TaxID=201153 RepID=A0A8J6B7U1_9EUKA|nr:hypothetical protein J8273_0142 [Carpediemonas membranifera]|eukprot:KAG9394934.1 hypothetical protein J8273_0142 [Carpediemonas membranifera]
MPTQSRERWESRFSELVALKEQIIEFHNEHAVSRMNATSSAAKRQIQALKRDLQVFRSNFAMYKVTSGNVQNMAARLEDIRKAIDRTIAAESTPTPRSRRKKPIETEQTAGRTNHQVLQYQAASMESFDGRLDELYDAVVVLRKTGDGLGDELEEGADLIDDTTGMMTQQRTGLRAASQRVERTRRVTKGGLSLVSLNACLFLFLVLEVLTAFFIPSRWPFNK